METDGSGSQKSLTSIVVVELFAGIMVASLACESYMNCHVEAVYYSEIESDAICVASTIHSTAISLGPIEDITWDVVYNIVQQWPDSLFLVLGGPPCQNVSLLGNQEGAWGEQSCFREYYKSVFELFRRAVGTQSWQLMGMMECTIMGKEDRKAYDAVFGSPPFELCSRWFQPVTRPRWWWFSKQPNWENCNFQKSKFDSEVTEIIPFAEQEHWSSSIMTGWVPWSFTQSKEVLFCCFTRHKTRRKPMWQPRGLEQCNADALTRWRNDDWAQAPYQYAEKNLVVSKAGVLRRLIAEEEESLMGLPKGYTASLTHQVQEPKLLERRRKALLGNAWHLQVAIFCLQAVLGIQETPPSQQEQQCRSEPSFVPESVVGTSSWHTFLQLRNVNMPVFDDMRTLIKCECVGGPCEEDLYAATVAAASLNIQTKAMGTAVTRERLIPRGLSHDLHAVLARNLDHPLGNEVNLSKDLMWACRKVLEPSYPQWVANQIRLLEKCFRRMKGLKHLLCSLRSVNSSIVSPYTCPDKIMAFAESMGWPDADVVWLAVLGVPIVGDIQETGIFRKAKKVEVPDLTEFMASADEWNSKCSHAKPPPDEQIQAVWDKSLKESTLGILGELKDKSFFDQVYGKGNWRCMQRFAVFQEHNQDWRVIDNAKSSGHNLQSALTERIHTTATAVSMALSQLMYSLDPGVKQFRATRDMKSAYRQIPLWDKHAPLQIIAIFSPIEQAWKFAELRGLAFGLASAVLQFNRVPIFLVAIARRFLAVPAISFFDDVRMLAPEHSKEAVWGAFNWLVSQLGWQFDVEKDSVMSQDGPFLGILEQLSTVPLGFVKLEPKAAWLVRLQEMMTTAVSTGKLEGGEARTIQGKLLHLASVCEGRVGRGQVFAFAEFLKRNSNALTPELCANLRFHLALIELRPWRIVPMQRQKASPVIIYTDASCGPTPAGMKVVLCYVIISDTYKSGGIVTLNQEVLNSMELKKTFIAHGEAFAPLFCLFHEQTFLRNKAAIWFIDNMGILACYCKGASVIGDIACICHASLLTMAHIRLQSWFEHVDSKANVADGGTRGESEVLGIRLPGKTLPPWPLNTLRAEPEVWIGWLCGQFKPNHCGGSPSF